MSHCKSKTVYGWTLVGQLFLCAALSVTLGCREAGKKKGSEAASADKTGAAATKKETCDEYADKVCKEAGEQSPTCQNMKGAVGFMPPAACQAGLADLDFTKKKIAETRKKCTELMDKLCADLGPGDSCEMVRTQTARFTPQRCESLMQNYDKVLAQIKRQEEAKKPLTPEKQAMISQGPVPSFGPKDAKVTLVEFSDFQCPYCSRAGQAAKQIKEKYGDKIRFVFRQFPLSFHKQAHLASQAALAADAEGKFWPYHDLLFENQRQLDRPSLEKYAKQVGLNMAKFKKALDDTTYAKAVDADLELGKQVAVSGTPTMFLNGTRVPNPTDFAGISKLIDAALGGGGAAPSAAAATGTGAEAASAPAAPAPAAAKAPVAAAKAAE